MRAEDRWKPTKFERRGGHLTVGPNAGGASWLITRLVAEAYERHLPDHARGRLIDLGCGNVPLFCAYRDLVQNVVCVDWSGSQHALIHVDLEHDLNQALPFGDGAFETVILSDVLEHVRRPTALLTEIRRILVPGGKLLANVPFMYWLHEQPHDYYRFTEHCLRWSVEQAGLCTVVLEPLGGGLEVIADVAAKHIAQLPILGGPCARALQQGTFIATNAAPLRGLLGASRQRFPLAYFLVAESSAGTSAAPPASSG